MKSTPDQHQTTQTVSTHLVNSHWRTKVTEKMTEKQFCKIRGWTKVRHDFELSDILKKAPIDTIIHEMGWKHLQFRRNRLYHYQWIKLWEEKGVKAHADHHAPVKKKACLIPTVHPDYLMTD